MAQRIRPIECDRIIERHAALGCTEVALSRHDTSDLVGIELIVRNDDGTYARSWIGGLFAKRDKNRAAGRLMDFHAGVVAAQRALGMQVDRRFA